MKVLEIKIINDETEVWFRVKLDRNTSVLSQELFTQNDIDNAKKEAIREFLAKLYESWANT